MRARFGAERKSATRAAVDPRPLGEVVRRTPVTVALALAGGAALLSTLLLELSRTLAERARGRWYAGNGRDLFHAGAAAALFAALAAAGLPLPLAAVCAAAICALPLLALDDLPRLRKVRLALLFAFFAAALCPPVLDPQAVADLGNAVARAAFPRSR